MGRHRKADNARRGNLLRARNTHNEPHDDIPGHSIDRDPDGEDECEDIADESQLKKFIHVLRMAQLLAHKQEKEKANATNRPRTYTKNAPRTLRRRRKAQSEYQAAGGKLITNWFSRKEASIPVNEVQNVLRGTRHETPSGLNAEVEGIEMDPEDDDLRNHIPDVQLSEHEEEGEDNKNSTWPHIKLEAGDVAGSSLNPPLGEVE